jgi:6-phosphogluconolactonase
MCRHSDRLRIFLTLLLSLALGWPETSLATKNLSFPRRVLNRNSLGHYDAFVKNTSLSGIQFWFGALLSVDDPVDNAEIQDVASTTEISNRSILGAASGALAPIRGGINSCCCAAGVVVDPVGLFVLTTDSVRNRVCVHKIDSETGALTPVQGSPFSTGGNSAERIAMDPAGEFAFVTNSSSNDVSVFSFDLDTGALTPVPGSPFPAGSQPLDVTTDGFGRFLFVANNLSNSISAFSINQSNGALTPIAGSPFSMGSFLSRVEADPLGRFLYAMDGQRVFVLSIGATGALTPATGSPLALNPGPSALAADPSGRFLLVTQSTRFIGQSDTLASYQVNANGSLSLIGSPVSLGEGVSPSAVAADRGGQWVSVANQSTNSASTFSLNPTTGILTPVPGSPFPAGPGALDAAIFSGLANSSITFLEAFFSEKPTVSGGTPPYSWSIASGALPAGLALNAATGILSGTPTSQGTSTFTIRVADSVGQSASQEFSIRVLSKNLPAAIATLPSSARAEGLNGAFYTTDVTASNVSSSSASLTFKFLGNNQNGTTGEEKTYTLVAGRTQTFSDILGSVFGRASDYGAISVSSDSLAVAVLGQTSTPGFGGTFGQSVPISVSTELIRKGAPRWIVAIREDVAFRTNLILSNGTATPLDVDLNLVAENGAALGSKRVNLPPLGMTQVTRVVRDLGVAADVTGARLVLSTPTSGGAFAAYASVIDNVTNDPRTLLPKTAPIPYDKPYRWYLPSSARAGGAGGAFYTTDLTVANVGTTTANYFLKFLGNNRDGSVGPQRSFSLAAGRSATFSDVLKSVFNLDSDYGAIQVGGSEDLVVLGQTSTPGFGGTFGQSVPAMEGQDLISAGKPRSIVAVRDDASFRTNLILCGTTEFVSVDVDVALISPEGATLGTKRYRLPPFGMIQVSRVARELGATGDLNGARLDLSTPTASGSFAAYASVIDNVTNDPRTLLPQ